MLREVDIGYGLSNLTKPENVVLVVSIGKAGKANLMPAGWQMRTSFNPPMLAEYWYDQVVAAYENKDKKKILLNMRDGSFKAF